MTRKLSFAFVVVTAFIVAACGRQVTPNPVGLGPGGAPPGYLSIHFDVQSPFNFSNYQYMIVFNTTGSGVTPSTQTVQTNWAGYSFALLALGTGINTYAEAVQFVRSTQNPHSPPAWLNVHPTPVQLSFNPNSNGAGTEFSMLAQKVIFKGISSPAPAPSATPANWTFNAFVTQASNGGQWTFYDSMGAGGVNPPEFVSPVLNMDTCFDNTYYAQYTPPDPAAQIVSLEISNNPAPPHNCSTSEGS